jgi:hypothetical protein
LIVGIVNATLLGILSRRDCDDEQEQEPSSEEATGAKRGQTVP